MSEKSRWDGEIQTPASSYSPAAWQALTMLATEGERRCVLRSELKRGGVTDEELRTMTYFGRIVQRAASFDPDTDPDDAWAVEITPGGRMVVDFAHMHLFLCSIASAQPQGEQGEWMVKTANEGLRRASNPTQGEEG